MKKQYRLIALSVAAVFAGSAFAAADTGKTASTESPKARQQSRMALCNKEAKAKEIKGAERKQFMSTCLKKDKATKA